MASETVGHLKCPWCDARVPVRLNKNGEAYFWCTGKADTRACASKATLGPFPTDAALREMGVEIEGASDGSEQNAADTGGAETLPEGGVASGDEDAADDPERGAEGGGFGLF